MRSIEDRFWDKVGPHDDPTKCWLWLGAMSKGHCDFVYGRIKIDGKSVYVHRLSYEMHYHVPIPEGMTIDHVKALGCTSTLCVNPHHLEVVTQKVNVLRGDSFAAKEAKVMHCPQGHPYNKENTYVWLGVRHCRVCRAEARERYLAKKTMLGGFNG